MNVRTALKDRTNKYLTTSLRVSSVLEDGPCTTGGTDGRGRGQVALGQLGVTVMTSECPFHETLPLLSLVPFLCHFPSPTTHQILQKYTKKLKSNGHKPTRYNEGINISIARHQKKRTVHKQNENIVPS